MGELYRVLTDKDKREVILGWTDSFEVADSSWSAFLLS